MSLNHIKALWRQVNGIEPTNIYLLNINNRNTRKRSHICSKLEIKTPYDMVHLLLPLNIFHTFLLCFCCWLWTCIFLLENVDFSFHSACWYSSKQCPSRFSASKKFSSVIQNLLERIKATCLWLQYSKWVQKEVILKKWLYLKITIFKAVSSHIKPVVSEMFRYCF